MILSSITSLPINSRVPLVVYLEDDVVRGLDRALLQALVVPCTQLALFFWNASHPSRRSCMTRPPLG